MSKIYVASSWRNNQYEDVLGELLIAGHEIWDWRDPPTGTPPFRWQDIVPDYTHGHAMDTDQFLNVIEQPHAIEGFHADFKGMQWCDLGVLLLPAGRSAHIEAGWIRGQAKDLYIIRPDDQEPDLMHKLTSAIFKDVNTLVRHLET